MTGWATAEFWERATAGWRGPLLAALVAVAAVLPGLLALPPLDRDESRFAQATAQMLETGDLVNIRFQDAPRDKKPVGIHWLQAAAVKLVSSAEARDIRPYRLPSLLGAALAAAACAWGASAAWGSARGALAGALLGATTLLSTEGGIAKTDAVLCGAVVLSMAALGRIYGEARGGAPAGRGARALFWAGQSLAVLDKGPIGPMVAALALSALWIADRDAAWMRRLGWGWGLALMAATVGPWAFAVTIATDGRFWAGAVGGDLAPKLAGGHEGHGAPPGLHTVLAPILAFPMGLMLPAAAVVAWRSRREAMVRFALAWLVPSWIVFELLPTKLIHYPLPLYGALAWLSVAALATPGGPWTRGVGAALALAGGGALSALALVGAARYGASDAAGVATLAAGLSAAAGVAGAILLVMKRPGRALVAAGVMAIAAHGVLAGLVAPRLNALWLSQRTATLIARAHLDPRNGVTPGPVAATGYAEPSLVFALGTETELDTPIEAAQAAAAGQPTLVEDRETAKFTAALSNLGVVAHPVGAITGTAYSVGRKERLTLWLAGPPTPAAPR